jgi:FkbM family methyltransferase
MLRKTLSIAGLFVRLILAIIKKEQNFIALPLSPFGTTWLIKKKKGNWRFIRLRPGTSDLGTFLQIFVYEDYRLQRLSRWNDIQKEYAKILSGGRRPVIVDCGANNGLSVLYFREMFPESIIVALEPEERNFKELNRYSEKGKILCLKAAVSNKNGRVQLSDPHLGEWGFRVEKSPARSPNTVPAYTIPSILTQARKMGPTVPFLVKIDIEGHEDSLFLSGTQWIREFSVLIIELHDWMLPQKANSRRFLKVISSENRDFVFFGENVFSLRNSSIK